MSRIDKTELVEEFLSIEATMKVLAKRCEDARKKLSDEPAQKLSEKNQRRQQLLINRERSRIRSAQRKQRDFALNNNSKQ